MGFFGYFARFAKWTSHASGHPLTFVLALLVVISWAITGPVFGFSDTWQLVINTGTTIVTFLMVFLIQNTQTRDTQAIQVKLDELIRAVRGAHDDIMDLEDLPDNELQRVRAQYAVLAEEARNSDTHATEEVSQQPAPVKAKARPQGAKPAKARVTRASSKREKRR